MASIIRGDDNFDSSTSFSTTLGAVGTYAFLYSTSNSSAGLVAGTSYAASGLRYSGYTTSNIYDGNLYSYGTSTTAVSAGTWKAMGHARDTRSTRYNATLFVRIS